MKETHGPCINNVHRPTALNRLHNTHKVMAGQGLGLGSPIFSYPLQLNLIS